MWLELGAFDGDIGSGDELSIGPADDRVIRPTSSTRDAMVS
jgi:hypothetical protein